MSSSVAFRMQQGSEYAQIHFNGAHITLLDLKREIFDRKFSTSSSADFDFKVVDTNGVEYQQDDEKVPKDLQLIVRRIFVKNQMGLLARLKGKVRGSQHAGQSGEIVMPMKQEAAPVVETETVAPGADATGAASFELDDSVSKGLEALQQQGEDGAAYPTREPWRGGPGGRGGGGRGGMVCTRCGDAGHLNKYCPTIGDPKYDPAEYSRIANIPKALRTTVDSLEGIDMTNKSAIQNEDGTYDIVSASASGLKALTRDGAGASDNFDMSTVPDALKCAMSGTFLREAVQLPCCKKCVNDSAVRPKLIAADMTCPLCSTAGTTPEDLVLRKDIRKSVDDWITKKKEEDEENGANKNKSDEDGGNDGDKSAAETAADPWGGYGAAMAGAGGAGAGGMNPMMGGMSSGYGAQGAGAAAVPPGGGMGMGMGMGAMPGMGMMGVDMGAMQSMMAGNMPPPNRAMLPPPMSKVDFLKEQELQLRDKKNRPPNRDDSDRHDRDHDNRDSRNRGDRDHRGDSRGDRRGGGGGGGGGYRDRDRSRSTDRNGGDYGRGRSGHGRNRDRDRDREDSRGGGVGARDVSRSRSRDHSEEGSVDSHSGGGGGRRDGSGGRDRRKGGGRGGDRRGGGGGGGDRTILERVGGGGDGGGSRRRGGGRRRGRR